jgi:hypothetical protein
MIGRPGGGWQPEILCNWLPVPLTSVRREISASSPSSRRVSVSRRARSRRLVWLDHHGLWDRLPHRLLDDYRHSGIIGSPAMMPTDWRNQMTDEEMIECLEEGKTSKDIPWCEVRMNELPGMIRDGKIAERVVQAWMETMLPDDLLL